MNKIGVVDFLKYDDVLESIQNTENHLLLGNGFNRGLGVDTSYKSIFLKMLASDYSVYADVQGLVEQCNYDLEVFIGEICKSVGESDIFLPKYISNKIKLDFMRAAQEIVKSGIRNVYNSDKEGVFLLLKNFTNYFTLNYDSFLYLLLMKYKPSKDTVIAFQPTLNFQKNELNVQYDNIYDEIKQARDKGFLNLQFGITEDMVSEPLRITTRAHFITEAKEYSKLQNKGWSNKEIKRTVDLILEEERDENRITSADDGFRIRSLFEENEYVYDAKNLTQNLFFLHGAFHVYRDGEEIKKITAKTDKALYDRLEEVLNSYNEELVCVFKNENKEEEIKRNIYLRNGLEKITMLSGSIVIIGCSFSDNDRHIFKKINESKITNLYISALEKECEKVYSSAKVYFPSKKVTMFDAKTISYKVSEESNTKRNNETENRTNV